VQTPEVIARTWQKARESDPEIGGREVREALHQFDALWEELFPAEQVRIAQLLVERVIVHADGLDIRLRTEGLTSLVADMRKPAAGSDQPVTPKKADRDRRAA
jgi:hypothetical protein